MGAFIQRLVAVVLLLAGGATFAVGCAAKITPDAWWPLTVAMIIAGVGSLALGSFMLVAKVSFEPDTAR